MRAKRRDKAAHRAPVVARPAQLAALDAFLERRGGLLVLALAAAHAILFGAIAAFKYRHYLYTDFDLAIFAHAESQMLRGTLYESIGGMPWMAGHFAPVLALLAPPWLVARHPLTLLFAQAIALASGAWAVRRLAKREIDSPLAAVVLPALWLLHPAVGYIDLFEFHPECFAAPALLFAFDALRAGRLRALAAWTALALLAREDVGLVVLALAAFALIGRRPGRFRAAALLGALGITGLVAAFGVTMPMLGSGQTDYAQLYGRWGHSLREVAGTIVRQPFRALAELVSTPGDKGDTGLKLLYWLQLLLPLGFLPLASPLALLVGLPIVFEHFLSSRGTEHTIVYHYTALVMPFAMAAAVVGLGSLARRPRGERLVPALLAGALVLSLASNALFGPVLGAGKLQGYNRPEPLKQEAYDRNLEPWRDRFLTRVPRTGGVVTSFELLTRFTDREGLHSLHHLLAGHYTFSHRAYATPTGVTGVIADLGTGSLFKWVDAGTSRRWADLLARNDLRPVDSADDLVLFARGARDTVRLWDVSEPTRPRPRPVVYDGQVAFVGSDAPRSPVAPGGRVPIRTWWRRVVPTDRLFLTEILVIGPDGRPVRSLWRYLGYMMHPVQQWPEGASVCETYRLIVPADAAPGRYQVGYRLWWRLAGQGQGICGPDDPDARAESGYVTAAVFDVAPVSPVRAP